MLKEGSRFSFVQAYRLLHFILSSETGSKSDDQEIHKNILVQPDLSLSFPESDITAIREISKEPVRYLITATFLGLYGTSSPLPTFYTEDLLYERLEDRTIARDFLDIINSPLYQIYFRSWSKYRLFYKICEQFDPQILQRLYCLLGLEEEEFQTQVEHSFSLLRYIGLATQSPRSAEGLRTLLSDSLNEPTIRIIQCVSRIVIIPDEQRFILGKNGSILGVNGYLGMEIVDRTGKFRIRMGPLDSDRFHRFLPDRPAFKRITQMVRFYLDQPLIWDIELILKGDTIQTAQLGSECWSQLGWNSWIFSENVCFGNVLVTLYTSKTYNL